MLATARPAGISLDCGYIANERGVRLARHASRPARRARHRGDRPLGRAAELAPSRPSRSTGRSRSARRSRRRRTTSTRAGAIESSSSRRRSCASPRRTPARATFAYGTGLTTRGRPSARAARPSVLRDAAVRLAPDHAHLGADSGSSGSTVAERQAALLVRAVAGEHRQADDVAVRVDDRVEVRRAVVRVRQVEELVALALAAKSDERRSRPMSSCVPRERHLLALRVPGRSPRARRAR